MKRTIISLLACGLLSACGMQGKEACEEQMLKAPNGRLYVCNATENNGALKLAVCRSTGDTLFSISSLGLNTSESTKYVLKKVSEKRDIVEKYKMQSGKRLACENEGVEKIFTLEDNKGTEQNIIVRVYNDGIAYRYELPMGGEVSGESSTYDMSSSFMNCWLQKYNTPYEDLYDLNTEDEAGKRYGFPSLFEMKEGVFVLLTEADVHHNNSAASLWGNGNHTYRVAAEENVGCVAGSWQSPWRVAIVGTLADVVESTLVTDVSEANKIDETNWIKPGVASWIYWAYNHGSNDYQIVKSYIDMAYELNLPYVLIDAEWDEMGNGGTIEDAINYANEKGVRTLLWYNSTTAWLKEWGAPGPYYRLNKVEDRQKEFTWLEKMGVAGIKVDFFDGDKTATMDYCIDILEDAAKYHLLVNFHGATIPRGWQRTYPNLMTTEAVYGAEWYNNTPRLTLEASMHNATLPFTRGVIGPMDYTPCTFTDSQHQHITTDSHELALTVLFESGIVHLADRPSSYLSQPDKVKEFLSSLPTAWDETKLVAGYPGKFAIIARRKEENWYIAGVNGMSSEQAFELNIETLNTGDSNWTIFEDGDGGWKITSNTSFPTTINLKPRGGFVAVMNK